MKYYLEPNSLTSLPSDWIKSNRPRCYTSYLALLEIVSGIDETNFSEKKKILLKVENTRIKVDWRMPQQILAQAFGINYVHDTRTKPFKNTVSLITSQSSYESVCDISARKQRYWSMHSLKTADSQVAIPDSLSSITLSQKARSVLTEEELRSYRLIFQKPLESLDPKEQLILGELLDVVQKIQVEKTIVELLLMVEGKTDKTVDRQQLLKNYKCTIDHYFFLRGYRILKNTVLSNQPGVNDSYDTHHLLYLEAADSVIVTDDNKFCRDMEFLWKKDKIFLRKAEALA